MSTIERMYNETMDIERTAKDPENGIKSPQTHISDHPCRKRPFDEELELNGEANSFGKAFKLYCPVADIKQSDTPIIGGERYSIEGVVKNDIGNNPHMKLIIRT